MRRAVNALGKAAYDLDFGLVREFPDDFLYCGKAVGGGFARADHGKARPFGSYPSFYIERSRRHGDLGEELRIIRISGRDKGDAALYE